MALTALAGTLIPMVSNIVGKFLTSKGDKAKMLSEISFKLAEQETKLIDALVKSDVAQIEINKIEAKKNGWKANARPLALWTCVVGFILSVLTPYLSWTLALCGIDVPLPPTPPALLNTMLFGLLGLSAVRSHDKLKGLTK